MRVWKTLVSGVQVQAGGYARTGVQVQANNGARPARRLNWLELFSGAVGMGS
jgi:hypothetical protein